MQQSVALIVIYNHKYDKNIDIVEGIYKDRFSTIFHLVPFYTGSRKNVIPVYENSHHFQGYVAQGFQHFKGHHTHYFFIADDLILNPVITEQNYATLFGLDETSGFLPELDPMPEGKWPHDRAAVTFDPAMPGVEVTNELPSPQEARAVIDALGVANGPYTLKATYFWNRDFSVRNLIRQFIRYAYDRYILKADYKASKYPFVRSYSDIFIVSGAHAATFAHYCGVFAATNLWVELAIPTALVLSGEKVRVQAQMRLQGKPLWSAEDHASLAVYGQNLKKLLDNFPKDYIYLHPIKLSKWKVEQ